MTIPLLFVGFGLVARRFIELLLNHETVLADRDGLRWTIVALDGIESRQALATRNGEKLTSLHAAGDSPPPDKLTLLDLVATQARERATDTTTRVVVVESTRLGLNGGQPSLDHVRRALTSGTDVITANKGPAEFVYRELSRTARECGRDFLFEGAVLDGLPVFSLLRDTLPMVQVRGFRGIVNTTTNYVLSAMAEGQSLDTALDEMRLAGTAEADASNDIDGSDAAAKTAVLANTLMGADITPHDEMRVGLRGLSGRSGRGRTSSWPKDQAGGFGEARRRSRCGCRLAGRTRARGRPREADRNGQRPRARDRPAGTDSDQQVRVGGVPH